MSSISLRRLVNEAISIVSSRQKLKQFLTTPLYGNAFYLMFNSAVMAFFGLFFWLVVARFYSEAEVGFSSAIISAIHLITIISMVGLNTSLIRFLPHAAEPQELINSCYTVSGGISLLLAAIFVVCLGFCSPALAFVGRNVIFASAFIIFTGLHTLSSQVSSTFVAKRRADFVLSKDTLYSVLKIPLPIFFGLFFHAFGVVASWGVAVGAALAIALFVFLPKVQHSYKPVPTLRWDLMRSMWRYSGGNYLANLLASATTLILPIMVVNLLSPERNAYFYVAWTIAGLLFAIPAGVSQSLFAEGSHFEDRLRDNVKKSLIFTFLLLVPAVVVLILTSKWLLLAFGQSYSSNGSMLLRILAISGLPFAISQLYCGILRVRGRLKELIAIKGFITLPVLLASYLIMPATGIVGIGYIWLGAQVVVAIYVLARRLSI